MIHGVINLYKEKGYTSHDAVAKLRGILHQKKIGHTGTLDPDAEGVLPVCMGAATKLCDMLTDTEKEYRARMLLGRRPIRRTQRGEYLRKARSFRQYSGYRKPSIPSSADTIRYRPCIPL